ncbi:glycosyltransferase [Polaribacter vadi]|uniref:glycosyltransferase n=1 Tax=Polaribacter TaxID=52959 RepID=UPI001C08E77B|nr:MULTISPECIES: glycosyltransferase [Polaribacter]MBU3009827.1 glycosyltransferase [Polaribacter vadi]MDO6739633.1 glycosyltransferase [Polaribacter sp. 1_MG-2023]
MKKVIVSVTNDLTTDQRVHKVCTTLVENNFDVLLVGRKLKSSIEIDRNYKTKRLKLVFNQSFLFYAEFNFRLFLFLLFKKKHILLANDLDTLLANFLVSKLQQKKLVYDSHELFSEVPELVNKPFKKSIWVGLEKMILPKLKHTYTVCNSIAEYYKNLYQTNFTTIRNLPKKKEVIKDAFSFDVTNKNVILYQGVLNVGRGLELMIDAVPFLNNTILVIIGDGDIATSLKTKITEKGLQNKVYFLGKLNPEELHKLTPNANIGISFEEDLGLNYRYALPNKIFDYIQAEIPILVSDLPEMKRIVTEYKVGEIIEKRTPEAIANQIETMLKKDFSNALVKAKSELIWEAQEQLLLSHFK